MASILPREVGAHGPPLQSLPLALSAICLQGSAYRFHQGPRSAAGEGEAQPGFRVSSVIPNGLGQAAGATDDGDRAVAQRDQRSKAARLEGGRSQKEIRPGVY